jgi:hypothetical protein
MSLLFQLIAGLGCAAVLAASGEAPPHAAPTDADELRISACRTIDVPVEGCVTGSLAKAFAVLRETNLLDQVQAAYAAQLPASERPEFVVQSTAPGRYHYVNKDGERCDIRELWRRTDTNSWIEVAFHVQGERRFGTFESLIYLTVSGTTAGPTGVLHYAAKVRAWPHQTWARLLLRYLPGVELYFRMKTAEMRGVITRVFTRLAAE